MDDKIEGHMERLDPEDAYIRDEGDLLLVIIGALTVGYLLAMVGVLVWLAVQH